MTPAETSTAPVSRSTRKIVLGAALCFILAIAWWWPSLSPPGDNDVDVSVVTDGFLEGFARPVGDRIHESGRSTSWTEGLDVCTSWSGIADQVANAEVLVVTDARLHTCPLVIDDALDRVDHVIVVAQPGRLDVGSIPSGVVVVDPERLVGRSESGVTMPCQWWEQVSCVNGFVAVRNHDGSLTAEGSDRVARMVTAALP